MYRQVLKYWNTSFCVQSYKGDNGTTVNSYFTICHLFYSNSVYVALIRPRLWLPVSRRRDGEFSVSWKCHKEFNVFTELKVSYVFDGNKVWRIILPVEDRMLFCTHIWSPSNPFSSLLRSPVIIFYIHCATMLVL